RAKAVQLVKAARFDRVAEIVERMYFKLVVEQLDPFRSKARQRSHLAQLTGQLFLQRFEQLEVAGLDDVSDFASQIFANARQLGKVSFGRQHATHALRQPFYGTRGAAISAHAKLV